MAARGACAAAYQSAAGRYLVSRCQRDCGDADCLREEIRHLGYVEQVTIALDFRLSNGIMDALPALAAELPRAHRRFFRARAGSAGGSALYPSAREKNAFDHQIPC